MIKILAYLTLLNILSLILMYIDKKNAINKRTRIKEKTLITISFLGGCIGSYLGMQIFRHKTKHLKFKILIPLSIFIWITILLSLKLKNNLQK